MKQQPTALRMTDPGIRELFSEDRIWQSWLDVEAALAQAQADLDVIPSDAAEEITRKSRLELLDRDAVYEGLARTGHPLVPLIWELDRICDGDAGGYVHWGATTQNITQTGFLLQLRRAHRIYLGQIAHILTLMADLADETKEYVLPGRTHGQHAVPSTFGLKVAVWIDEILRHVERVRGCEDRVFVAMLGGGAGTLGSLGEIGLDIQDGMAEKLDMGSMPMPSRDDGGPPLRVRYAAWDAVGDVLEGGARGLHDDEAGVRRGGGACSSGNGRLQHDAAEAKPEGEPGYSGVRRSGCAG